MEVAGYFDDLGLGERDRDRAILRLCTMNEAFAFGVAWMLWSRRSLFRKSTVPPAGTTTIRDSGRSMTLSTP